MSIRQRVQKLEDRHRLAEPELPIHHYEKNAGDPDRPHRVECPTCAAMSDEEYAEYDAIASKSKGITHIIIVRPKENPDNGAETASWKTRGVGDSGTARGHHHQGLSP